MKTSKTKSATVFLLISSLFFVLLAAWFYQAVFYSNSLPMKVIAVADKVSQEEIVEKVETTELAKNIETTDFNGAASDHFNQRRRKLAADEKAGTRKDGSPETVSEETWQSWQEAGKKDVKIQQQANELGAIMNFQHEFQRWRRLREKQHIKQSQLLAKELLLSLPSITSSQGPVTPELARDIQNQLQLGLTK